MPSGIPTVLAAHREPILLTFVVLSDTRHRLIYPILPTLETNTLPSFRNLHVTTEKGGGSVERERQNDAAMKEKQFQVFRRFEMTTEMMKNEKKNDEIFGMNNLNEKSNQG